MSSCPVEPVISPAGAVGFRQRNPLDSSNCYLRLLEASIRTRGIEGDELACALLHPFDLRLARDAGELTEAERQGWFLYCRYAYAAHSRFPALDCRFRRVEPSLLSAESVTGRVLLLDCTLLPWHPSEGPEHRIMHSVYVRSVGNGMAELLDTDATETGFVRIVPLAPLCRAVVKVGEISHHPGWRDRLTASVRGAAARSREHLAVDLPRLAGAIDELRHDFPDQLYPAVYITMLVFFVPQTQLWAQALRHTGLGDGAVLADASDRLRRMLTMMSWNNLRHHRQGTPARYREMALETLEMHHRFCTEVVPRILP